MLTLLAEKLPELERLCKLHGVRRLEVVGSAAREVDFDPARSDIDLLVEFQPGRLPRLSGFFGLREAIENAIGRPVDLLMLEAVRNPYLKASLERNRLLLYAAEAGSIDSQAGELKVEGLAAGFSRSPTPG